MYQYRARITKVVDGDTVDALIDLGFGISTKIRLRIDDFDAPETWRPRSDLELAHGQAATKRAKELLLHNDVTINTSKLGIYGRWGGTIILDMPVHGKTNYADVMIIEGFSKKDEYKAPPEVIIKPLGVKT